MNTKNKITVKDAISISPVAPGLNNMKSLSFSVNGKTVYQFFGHVPSGYGTVIEYVDGPSPGFLINLDNSNSFMGSPAHRNLSDKSYNYVSINNGKVFVRTKLVVKASWTPISSLETIAINKNNKGGFVDKFFYSGEEPTKTIEIDEEVDLSDKDHSLSASKKGLSYHGKDSKGRLVLTYATGPQFGFKKNLYLVEEGLLISK